MQDTNKRLWPAKTLRLLRSAVCMTHELRAVVVVLLLLLVLGVAFILPSQWERSRRRKDHSTRLVPSLNS